MQCSELGYSGTLGFMSKDLSDRCSGTQKPEGLAPHHLLQCQPCYTHTHTHRQKKKDTDIYTEMEGNKNREKLRCQRYRERGAGIAKDRQDSCLAHIPLHSLTLCHSTVNHSLALGYLHFLSFSFFGYFHFHSLCPALPFPPPFC